MHDVCARTQSSRRKIMVSLIGAGPLLALSVARAGAVGGSPTAPKVEQSAAHYQPSPKEGKACAACYAFVAPDQCRFLKGEISPSGWCRLWKARPD